MTTITVTRPATVVAPRGAAWAASLATSVLGLVSRTLESRAQTKALKTRAEEAAAVRGMAELVRRQDPRFAADLLAAADRHERA
jgi:hypothetical protein